MKNRILKYAYNINTVKRGDKIALCCQHKDCKRFIVAIVNDESTMQCYVPCYRSNYDMRTQSWYCNKHKTI